MISGTTAPGHCQSQQPCGAPTKIASRGTRRRQGLEGWLGFQQEPLAGFGHPDTACRADEQCDAKPRLQGAHGLARRRGRDAEFGRRAAEAAMARHREEHLNSVERAAANCEVLFHSQSTLSRIVGRCKRT